MVDGPLLTVEDLSVVVEGRRLLEGVSFSVEPGERLVILGVSGSGKSILIDALAGNVPHAGAVRYRHDLQKKDIRFCFDQFATIPLLKTGEVVKLMENVLGAPRNEEILERLRINEMWDKLVKVLSKGERKRLGVYVALFTDPSLVVMDEPTDGMDPFLREAFWKIIGARRGATIISTHLWDEARENHDRIMMISEGKLLAPPVSVADLFAKVPYRGKIITTEAHVPAGGFRHFVHDGRRFIFFSTDEEKQVILQQLSQTGEVAGYTLLPLDMRDLYALFGGKLTERSGE